MDVSGIEGIAQDVAHGLRPPSGGGGWGGSSLICECAGNLGG